MYVNNEVGTINPIHKIASIVHKKNPKTKYHVDMVQALGKLPITLDDIDLATFSAHKVFGLKGSGYSIRSVLQALCLLLMVVSRKMA